VGSVQRRGQALDSFPRSGRLGGVMGAIARGVNRVGAANRFIGVRKPMPTEMTV
jgi:hypothetical protein